ncbi:MAG: dihydroorotate dehydrogenase electron transfer subunit [Anaerorhabdus sp.]
MIQSKLMRVINNSLIAKDTYKIVFEAKLDAKAGQFVDVLIPGFTLRRPLSISRIYEDSFEIIYKIKGEGTKVLSDVKAGEMLDVLGPLGNGFELVKNKKVLLIGGGIGIPPLLQLYHDLKGSNKVELLIGLNSSNENAYDEYQPFVATLDDSAYQGNVIDYIKNHNLDFDYIYSCGPMGMLKAIDKLGYDGEISIEQRMACGFGVCRGCTCKTKNNKKKRVCVEGPVFKIGEVNLDEYEN